MSEDERVGLLIDAGDARTRARAVTTTSAATSRDGVEEDLEVGGDSVERRRQRRHRASSSSSCVAVGVLTSLLATGAAIGFVGKGVLSTESRSVFSASLGDKPTTVTSTSTREGRATERQNGRRMERRTGRVADRQRARRETKTKTTSDADLGTEDDDPAVGSVVFLTYSDKLTDGLCVGGETAAMRGIDLHMLGVSKADERFDESGVKNVKTKKIVRFSQSA